jgi:tetratricopeptide (TPR) repeat protein
VVLRSPRTEQTAQSQLAIDFASAALRSGDLLGARRFLHGRLAEDPCDADALTKLAEMAAGQWSIDEATVLLRRAATADPSPQRRFALVRHFQRFGKPALAQEELEQLPDDFRAHWEVREFEAAVAGMLGMQDREVELLEQVIRQRPSDARLLISLGKALRTVGRAADAVKAFRRAIRARPTCGEAWWGLANLKSFQFADKDIALMQRTLAPTLPELDAANLHFALGKAFEDRGDYATSFRHYAAGNALRFRSFSSEQASVSASVDRAIALATPEFFERTEGAGCPEPGPIFVVGLHRSGSTLIEQILASHPAIEATGELAVLPNIYNRLQRAKKGFAPGHELTREELRAIGREYLENVAPLRRGGRPYFVDKMPGNWICLPLIRAALPNARIIDARRHPMACGFSNFKQNYPNGVAHSFDLKSMGLFYRDYWRFMRHFDAVQPGAAHRLIHERLVEDPEREIRAMLDYLGLPFAESCLEFHKSHRAVRTPSAEQVRRPIDSAGLDQWRHYEPWLGELKEALGPALRDWES